MENETRLYGMNEIELANIEHDNCLRCNKPIRECWCFADDNALDGCRCNIPNAGLPLTGDGICQVCGKAA